MEGNEVQVRIRAHNLLCLQGFVGLGYSRDFVENMRHIKDRLRDHPETEIEVTAESDVICERCPHLDGGVCTVDGPVEGTIDNATRMDHRVLEHLGFSDGDIKLWGDILYVLGQKVDSKSIEILCGDCQWKNLDHCARVLDELHRRAISGEITPPAC
jgi:hypothetical protein